MFLSRNFEFPALGEWALFSRFYMSRKLVLTELIAACALYFFYFLVLTPPFCRMNKTPFFYGTERSREMVAL